MIYQSSPFNPEQDLILVYQIPKVASTSLGEGLRRYFPNVKVTHYLSDYSFSMYQQMVDHMGRGGLPVETIKSIASIINATNEINARFRTALNAGRRVKIITGVRDPLDLSVSALFHNISTISAFHHWMYQSDPQAATSIFSKLIKRFFENTYQDVPCENGVEMLMRMGINMTEWWFESEFNAALNLDLTHYPFDHKQGYAIYAIGQLDILLFRFEDRFRVMEQAVGQFVGVPRIAIPKENVGDLKSYAGLYKEVRSSLVFQEPILDIKYNIPYARHFYTAEEITAFRTRWGKKGKTGG